MLLTENSAQSLTNPYHFTDSRRLHYYDKGDNIPLVTDGLWQVYRGIVQLSQLRESGDEVLLGWSSPATFFGLWLTHIEAYQAKALSDIYLRWYSLKEIESSPQLSQLLFTQLANRMRQTEALLAIAGYKRVEDRLMQLLHLLQQELGQATEQGTRLVIRLTHQNIANAIGTTRVTVTRILGDFQRQKLISLDSDRHIIIAQDK
jgi:CRP-like cAMP-binding protein